MPIKPLPLIFLSVLLLTVIPIASGSDSSTAPAMFDMQNLFESVRIPNIVVTTDGTVLAFARSGRLLRRK